MGKGQVYHISILIDEGRNLVRIMQGISIFVSDGGDPILSAPKRGLVMENFGIFVTIFNPLDLGLSSSPEVKLSIEGHGLVKEILE